MDLKCWKETVSITLVLVATQNLEYTQVKTASLFLFIIPADFSGGEV